MYVKKLVAFAEVRYNEVVKKFIKYKNHWKRHRSPNVQSFLLAAAIYALIAPNIIWNVHEHTINVNRYQVFLTFVFFFFVRVDFSFKCFINSLICLLVANMCFHCCHFLTRFIVDTFRSMCWLWWYLSGEIKVYTDSNSRLWHGWTFLHLIRCIIMRSIQNEQK